MNWFRGKTTGNFDFTVFLDQITYIRWDHESPYDGSKITGATVFLPDSREITFGALEANRLNRAIEYSRSSTSGPPPGIGFR